MDRGELAELAVHYLAMLLLVFAVLAAVRTTVGETSFWIDLVIIAAVVFAYRPAVAYLDVAPSRWERR